MVICEIPKNEREIIIFSLSDVGGVRFLTAHTFIKKNGQLIPAPGKNTSAPLPAWPGLLADMRGTVRELQEIISATEKALRIIQGRNAPQELSGVGEFVRTASYVESL